MTDDHTADTHTTGTVAVGGSATGTIESAGDRDWFAVELVAGRTYQLDLQGSPTGHGTLADTFLRRILDANGNKSVGDGAHRTYNDDFGGSVNSRVTFTALESGTYYVETSGDRDETGTYTLSVSDVTPQSTPPEEKSPPPVVPDTPPADPDSVREGATDLNRYGPGQAVLGTLDGATDAVDYYTFTLPQTVRLSFGLFSAPSSDALHPDARLVLEDAQGNELMRSGAGTSRDAVHDTLAAGRYYLRVESEQAGSSPYEMRVERWAPGRLAVTDAVAHEDDGVVRFRVALNEAAPHAVTVRYDTVDDTAVAGEDYEAATGTLRFDKGEREKWVEVALLDDAVAEDGEAFGLRLSEVRGAVLDDAQAVGLIRDGEQVSVSEPSGEDFAANIGTAGLVMVGESVTGEVDRAGDVDWYAVELEAGTTYRIDLRGSPEGHGTLPDTFLRRILDAEGNKSVGDGAHRTYNDDFEGARDSRVLFTPTESGTYYIETSGDRIETGTYTLSVRALAADPDSEREEASELRADAPGGASAQATLDGAGDAVDYYRFELTAMKRVYLWVVPSASDPLVEPDVALVLEDAHGVEVARGIAGRDSRELIRDTLAAGTYYVRVEAQQAQSVTYTLTGRTLSPSEVAVSDAVAHESEDTTVRFRVALNEAAPNEVTVRYETVDGTAVAGEDYESVSDVLTFAVGETEKWVEVALIDDTVEDSGETFGLRLSEVTGAMLVDAEAVGTILNSETPVSVPEPDGMDFAADATTAGSVVVGESVTGNVDRTGDKDWFAVELEAGTTYRIDLEGSPTSRGTLGDPLLGGIMNADGELQSGTSNDNRGSGNNSRTYFTPMESGKYYVEAAGSGNGTGTYTLSAKALTASVPEPSGTDFSADTATEGWIAVGEPVTGNLERSGDFDWFAVELKKGTNYRFDLEGSWTGAGTLSDPYLWGIRDADGYLLPGTTNDNGGVIHNSRVFFTPDADGTYYVAAGSWASYHKGTYKLSVTEFGDDFSADSDTTGTVSVGGSTTGELETGSDVDWFAVTLEADQAYEIRLKGLYSGAGSLPDPYLHGIYDADSTFIAGTANDDGGPGGGSRVVFTPTEAGTYYVAAGTARTWSFGTYTLSVAETTDDFTGGTGTTGAVSVGGSTTGELETGGDVDWFAVTLEAGTRYRIDQTGVWDRDGSLREPVLKGVHDANGNHIAGTTVAWDGPYDSSRLFFEPAETGTYYVAAGGAEDFHGTYKLSVTDRLDDFLATKETTGAVSVDGWAKGELDSVGDSDWFAVTLEADRTYRIDLEGSSTHRGRLHDPYLRGIHDENGDFIAGTRNDNGGRNWNSRVTFTPAEDGTYYIATGATSNGLGTGNYEVRVWDVTNGHPDDYSAETGTTGAVSVGGSQTGEIETAGDRDWFAVTLEADKTYRFDLEGMPSGRGSLWDPYLRGIHNADGNYISGTSDDHSGLRGESRETFTPTQTGTYYVAAGANTDYVGSYTLTVEEVI